MSKPERKIVAYVSTNLVGSKIEDEYEVPENWDEMSEQDQEFYLDDIAKDHASSNSEWGAYIQEA